MLKHLAEVHEGATFLVIGSMRKGSVHRHAPRKIVDAYKRFVKIVRRLRRWGCSVQFVFETDPLEGDLLHSLSGSLVAEALTFESQCFGSLPRSSWFWVPLDSVSWPTGTELIRRENVTLVRTCKQDPASFWRRCLLPSWDILDQQECAFREQNLDYVVRLGPRVRQLFAVEVERAMGFPDNYTDSFAKRATEQLADRDLRRRKALACASNVQRSRFFGWLGPQI